MLEGVLARVVGKYGTAYLKDFGSEQVKTSLLAGTVELHDLFLRPEAVANLIPGLEVSCGCISIMKLQIPWRSLRTGKIHCEIAGLVIVVRPAQPSFSPQHVIKAALENLTGHLKHLLSQETRTMSKYRARLAELRQEPTKTSRFRSLLYRLQALVLNSVEIAVRDVYIAWDVGPFALAVSFSSLTVFGGETDKETGSSYKLGSITGLQAQYVQLPTAFDTSHADAVLEALKGLLDSSSSEALIEPFSCQLRAGLCTDFVKQRRPLLEFELTLSPFVLRSDLYRSFRFIDSLLAALGYGEFLFALTPSDLAMACPVSMLGRCLRRQACSDALEQDLSVDSDSKLQHIANQFSALYSTHLRYKYLVRSFLGSERDADKAFPSPPVRGRRAKVVLAALQYFGPSAAQLAELTGSLPLPLLSRLRSEAMERFEEEIENQLQLAQQEVAALLKQREKQRQELTQSEVTELVEIAGLENGVSEQVLGALSGDVTLIALSMLLEAAEAQVLTDQAERLATLRIAQMRFHFRLLDSGDFCFQTTLSSLSLVSAGTEPLITQLQDRDLLTLTVQQPAPQGGRLGVSLALNQVQVMISEPVLPLVASVLHGLYRPPGNRLACPVHQKTSSFDFVILRNQYGELVSGYLLESLQAFELSIRLSAPIFWIAASEATPLVLDPGTLVVETCEVTEEMLRAREVAFRVEVADVAIGTARAPRSILEPLTLVTTLVMSLENGAIRLGLEQDLVAITMTLDTIQDILALACRYIDVSLHSRPVFEYLRLLQADSLPRLATISLEEYRQFLARREVTGSAEGAEGTVDAAGARESGRRVRFSVDLSLARLQVFLRLGSGLAFSLQGVHIVIEKVEGLSYRLSLGSAQLCMGDPILRVGDEGQKISVHLLVEERITVEASVPTLCVDVSLNACLDCLNILRTVTRMLDEAGLLPLLDQLFMDVRAAAREASSTGTKTEKEAEAAQRELELTATVQGLVLSLRDNRYTLPQRPDPEATLFLTGRVGCMNFKLRAMNGLSLSYDVTHIDLFVQNLDGTESVFLQTSESIAGPALHLALLLGPDSGFDPTITVVVRTHSPLSFVFRPRAVFKLLAALQTLHFDSYDFIEAFERQPAVSASSVSSVRIAFDVELAPLYLSLPVFPELPGGRMGAPSACFSFCISRLALGTERQGPVYTHTLLLSEMTLDLLLERLKLRLLTYPAIEALSRQVYERLSAPIVVLQEVAVSLELEAPLRLDITVDVLSHLLYLVGDEGSIGYSVVDDLELEALERLRQRLRETLNGLQEATAEQLHREAGREFSSLLALNLSLVDCRGIGSPEIGDLILDDIEQELCRDDQDWNAAAQPLVPVKASISLVASITELSVTLRTSSQPLGAEGTEPPVVVLRLHALRGALENGEDLQFSLSVGAVIGTTRLERSFFEAHGFLLTASRSSADAELVARCHYGLQVQLILSMELISDVLTVLAALPTRNREALLRHQRLSELYAEVVQQNARIILLESLEHGRAMSRLSALYPGDERVTAPAETNRILLVVEGVGLAVELPVGEVALSPETRLSTTTTATTPSGSSVKSQYRNVSMDSDDGSNTSPRLAFCGTERLAISLTLSVSFSRQQSLTYVRNKAYRTVEELCRRQQMTISGLLQSFAVICNHGTSSTALFDSTNLSLSYRASVLEEQDGGVIDPVLLRTEKAVGELSVPDAISMAIDPLTLRILLGTKDAIVEAIPAAFLERARIVTAQELDRLKQLSQAFLHGGATALNSSSEAAIVSEKTCVELFILRGTLLPIQRASSLLSLTLTAPQRLSLNVNGGVDEGLSPLVIYLSGVSGTYRNWKPASRQSNLEGVCQKASLQVWLGSNVVNPQRKEYDALLRPVRVNLVLRQYDTTAEQKSATKEEVIVEFTIGEVVELFLTVPAGAEILKLLSTFSAELSSLQQHRCADPARNRLCDLLREQAAEDPTVASSGVYRSWLSQKTTRSGLRLGQQITLSDTTGAVQRVSVFHDAAECQVFVPKPGIFQVSVPAGTPLTTSLWLSLHVDGLQSLFSIPLETIVYADLYELDALGIYLAPVRAEGAVSVHIHVFSPVVVVNYTSHSFLIGVTPRPQHVLPPHECYSASDACEDLHLLHQEEEEATEPLCLGRFLPTASLTAAHGLESTIVAPGYSNLRVVACGTEARGLSVRVLQLLPSYEVANNCPGRISVVLAEGGEEGREEALDFLPGEVRSVRHTGRDVVLKRVMCEHLLGEAGTLESIAETRLLAEKEPAGGMFFIPLRCEGEKGREEKGAPRELCCCFEEAVVRKEAHFNKALLADVIPPVSLQLSLSVPAVLENRLSARVQLAIVRVDGLARPPLSGFVAYGRCGVVWCTPRDALKVVLRAAAEMEEYPYHKAGPFRLPLPGTRIALAWRSRRKPDVTKFAVVHSRLCTGGATLHLVIEPALVLSNGLRRPVTVLLLGEREGTSPLSQSLGPGERVEVSALPGAALELERYSLCASRIEDARPLTLGVHTLALPDGACVMSVVQENHRLEVRLLPTTADLRQAARIINETDLNFRFQADGDVVRIVGHGEGAFPLGDEPVSLHLGGNEKYVCKVRLPLLEVPQRFQSGRRPRRSFVFCSSLVDGRLNCVVREERRGRKGPKEQKEMMIAAEGATEGAASDPKGIISGLVRVAGVDVAVLETEDVYHRREVFRLHVGGIRADGRVTSAAYSVDFGLETLILRHFHADARYPVVLRWKPLKQSQHTTACLEVQAEIHTDTRILRLERLRVVPGTLHVSLDQALVETCVRLFQSGTLITAYFVQRPDDWRELLSLLRALATRNEETARRVVEALSVYHFTQQSQAQPSTESTKAMGQTGRYIYLGAFHLGRARLRLSVNLTSLPFRGNPFVMALTRLGAVLFSVERARLGLAPFEVRGELLHTSRLRERLVRAYARASALGAAPAVLLARPAFTHFSESFKKPGREDVGRLENFFAHNAAGVAGVVQMPLEGLGRLLDAGSMDKKLSERRAETLRGSRRSAREAGRNAFVDFATDVWSGIRGVVSKPRKGLQAHGTSGFFLGLGQGLSGVILKTLLGLNDLLLHLVLGVGGRAERRTAAPISRDEREGRLFLGPIGEREQERSEPTASSSSSEMSATSDD
ncbi:Chorein [Giardia muris]|uniref:Chorein n=1 Tax=Giardia muris TaxID=5742 RepID=A0A4Z1SZZ7_GIAMU|nr:Chorein [Giardia muris]|eukprot:TNJ27223.1 Chorein [Giardia muris]